MSAASELFAKARAALLVGAPFWGVLSLRLAPVEDCSIKTMETDGITIKFNPDFVAGLSRGVLRATIAHETMHCAALHHTRRGERNPRRWNIACDHAINPLLVEAGFELPDGALMDAAYAGMSAEEIYARLPDDAGDNGGDQAGNDPGGMGGFTHPPPGGGQPGGPGQDGGQPNGQSPSPADLARQEENWTIATAQADATAKSVTACWIPSRNCQSRNGAFCQYLHNARPPGTMRFMCSHHLVTLPTNPPMTPDLCRSRPFPSDRPPDPVAASPVWARRFPGQRASRFHIALRSMRDPQNLPRPVDSSPRRADQESKFDVQGSQQA